MPEQPREKHPTPAPAAAAETKTITAAGIVGDWQRKWSINQEQFNAALDDLELEIRRYRDAVVREAVRAAIWERGGSWAMTEAVIARIEGMLP